MKTLKTRPEELPDIDEFSGRTPSPTAVLKDDVMIVERID
jgi:hypothetical protein